MKMLRFSLGVTRVKRLRNEEIRERLGVTELEAKLREARLRWMGHVYRREDNYVGKRVERLVIGRKKRGRSKRRWRDNIREDLRLIDVGRGCNESSKLEEENPHRRPHLVGFKPVEEDIEYCYERFNNKNCCVHKLKLCEKCFEFLVGKMTPQLLWSITFI